MSHRHINFCENFMLMINTFIKKIPHLCEKALCLILHSSMLGAVRHFDNVKCRIHIWLMLMGGLLHLVQ